MIEKIGADVRTSVLRTAKKTVKARARKASATVTQVTESMASKSNQALRLNQSAEGAAVKVNGAMVKEVYPNPYELAEAKKGKIIRKKVTIYTELQDAIEEYSKNSGKLIKETIFNKDGKTVEIVTEYSEKTGYITKRTKYFDDGKTVDCLKEYNYEGNMSKQTLFREDGTLADVYEYNPWMPTALKKHERYRADGKSLLYITEYSLESGRTVKKTFYNEDGSVNKIRTLF